MCEMKFYGEEFTVTKVYERQLAHRQILLSEMVSRRTVIHPTLITTYGLTYNEYSGAFVHTLTIDDLFINYFDPSSVKVVFNDHLFNEDEIKGAQVYAVCGVRKSNSTFGSVDKYRTAFGLANKDNNSKYALDTKVDYINRPFHEALSIPSAAIPTR